MKPFRVVVAALVGGIIMFAWSAFLHMATPLGEAGMKSLPAESTVMPVLKQSLPEAGFYMFPGLEKGPDGQPTEAWVEKHRTGPAGILIFQPIGGEPMTPRHFIVEFGADVAGAFLAAIILGIAAKAGCSRCCGCCIGLGLGLFAWVNIDVSLWNWYNFPCELILAGLADQGIGWLVAGGAMGLIIGNGQKCTAAAA